MKSLFTIFALTFSHVSFAANFGLEVGFRQQSGSISTSTLTTKSQNGLQVGVTALMPINEMFGVRTGLLYTQRPLILQDSTGGEIKAQFSYFDIPVAAGFNFEDYATFFIGTALSMKLEDTATSSGTLAGTKINDVKNMLMPLQLGASFKFAPQLGATIYYEMISGDVAQNLNSYRAVGFNLVLTYD